VARTLQNSLLPEALPDVPGWDRGALRPAGPEAQVGGDFYDFWRSRETGCWPIGDVTGKASGRRGHLAGSHTVMGGIDFVLAPAALLAARRRRAQRARRCRSAAPSACACRTAGHRPPAAGTPLPFHLSDTGVAELGSPGTLLGAFSKVGWPKRSSSCAP